MVGPALRALVGTVWLGLLCLCNLLLLREGNHGLSSNKSPVLLLLQDIVFSLGTSGTERDPPGSRGARNSVGPSVTWVT